MKTRSLIALVTLIGASFFLAGGGMDKSAKSKKSSAATTVTTITLPGFQRGG